MFSSTLPGSTMYTNCKDYMKKKIKDWYGEDCLQWASDAEQQLKVPLSSWVSIDGFSIVTGRDLLRYNLSDFKRIVNDEYGPLFFKLFRRLVKERREDKASNKHTEMSDNLTVEMTSSFLDSSHWTVPQLEFSILEAPYSTDYGTSFDDMSRSIGGLSPTYRGASSPYESLSPTYGLAPSPYESLSPTYGGAPSPNESLSPTYGGAQSHYESLSPTYGGPSSSYGNLSPTYEEGASASVGIPPPLLGRASPAVRSVSPSFTELPHKMSQSRNSVYERKEADGSTYFTQTSMLSGGSISFGNSHGNYLKSEGGGSLDETNPNDLNASYGGCSPRTYEHEGCSSLLPDFNSLLIKDSPDKLSDSFDIQDMDSILNEESFDDLDNYIHSEEGNAAVEFQGGDTANGFSCAEASQFLLPEDSSLEDCMLKKITTGKRGNRVRHPQSWEFLVRLLMNPKSNPSLIKWEDKANGIFRLVQKEEIAKLWGRRSSKHKDEPLAYDNFARIIRYHYKKKILVPVSDKHLVYKLGDKILMDLKKQGLM